MLRKLGRGLANVAQATLAHVAPGIAEALIATAMGLFAAIPAVVAYNHFAGDLSRWWRLLRPTVGVAEPQSGESVLRQRKAPVVAHGLSPKAFGRLPVPRIIASGGKSTVNGQTIE